MPSFVTEPTVPGSFPPWPASIKIAPILKEESFTGVKNRFCALSTNFWEIYILSFCKIGGSVMEKSLKLKTTISWFNAKESEFPFFSKIPELVIGSQNKLAPRFSLASTKEIYPFLTRFSLFKIISSAPKTKLFEKIKNIDKRKTNSLIIH